MVTLAELREKHRKIIEDKEAPSEGRKSDFVTLNDGSNIVRVLPGKDELFNFYVQIASHKYQDQEGKWKTYQCRRTHNEKCPMCDLHFDLWKMHKELNLGKDSEGKNKKSKFGDLATKIKAKDRFYVRAVIRDLQAKNEDVVKFIAMSSEPFNIFMAGLTDPDTVDDSDPDNTTILSLDRGNDFDLKITKKGEFSSFAESKVKAKKSKAGTPQEILSWTESPLNLNSLVKLSDYDEGKKAVETLLASVTNVVKSDTDQNPPFKTEEEDDARFQKGLKA